MIAVMARQALSIKLYPGVEQQSDAAHHNALSGNRRFIAIALGQSVRNIIWTDTLPQLGLIDSWCKMETQGSVFL